MSKFITVNFGPTPETAPIHNNRHAPTRLLVSGTTARIISDLRIAPTQHGIFMRPTHVDYVDDTIYLGTSALTVDIAAAFDRVTRASLHNNSANTQMQAQNDHKTSETLD